MAAGITIKHKRKAGAFVNGELAAGEIGVDVSGAALNFSINGTTVNTIASGAGDMTKAVYDADNDGKVTASVDSDKLGGVAASSYATKSYADSSASSAVATVIAAAPATLDTLNELAVALGNDANFATTTANSLAAKVPNTRQVNGHALSADVTVTKSDVGLGSVINADQSNAATIVTGTMNNASVTLDGGTI